MAIHEESVLADETENKMDLETYEKLVDQCARERLDIAIPNGSPTHARILITKLFETARKEACLVTGSLVDTTENGVEVYGDERLAESARKFLARAGAVLRIIVLRNPLDRGAENRFLKTLVADKDRKGDIFLYYGHKSLKEDQLPHFMVTDALAYRFELDDEKTEAVANFGDDKTPKTLQKLFQEVSSRLDNNFIQRFQPGFGATFRPSH